MEKVQSFTGLNAWKEGHHLVLKVYAVVKKFPSEERFGLSSQLRRAVVSVTSNIAEGFRRKSKNEKQRFYEISLASLTEVQNELIISRDVGYLSPTDFQEIAEQTLTVGRLLTGLHRSAFDQKRS